VINCATKYLNAEFQRDKYFVDEVETPIKKKTTPGHQTQEIIQKTKLVTKHLYSDTLCSSHTFNSDTYLYVNASQPGFLT
jgi:hypothetical protein